MSSEPEYILLDRVTRNQLGEFETFEAAEEAFFDFVRPSPSAARHLEIWREGGTEPLPIDPEKLRAITAA